MKTATETKVKKPTAEELCDMAFYTSGDVESRKKVRAIVHAHGELVAALRMIRDIAHNELTIPGDAYSQIKSIANNILAKAEGR